MIVVVSKYLKKVKSRIDLRGKCCQTNSTSAIVQIRSLPKILEKGEGKNLKDLKVMNRLVDMCEWKLIVKRFD
jgi:hypothetical protein